MSTKFDCECYFADCRKINRSLPENQPYAVTFGTSVKDLMKFRRDIAAEILLHSGKGEILKLTVVAYCKLQNLE